MISPNPDGCIAGVATGCHLIQPDLSLRDCACGVIQDPLSRSHCQGDVPFECVSGGRSLCLLSCPTGSWQGFSRSQLLRAGPKERQAGRRYGELCAGGARGWGPLFARRSFFFGMRREKSNARRGFILDAARKRLSAWHWHLLAATSFGSRCWAGFGAPAELLQPVA